MKLTNVDAKGSTECIFSYIIIWGRQSPIRWDDCLNNVTMLPRLENLNNHKEWH